MAYRVYEYGVTALTGGEALLLDQVTRRNRYWNQLVEIERDYRAAMDAALRDTSVEVAEAERALRGAAERYESVQAAVNADKQASRSAKVAPERRAALTAARTALKEARQAHKAARQAAFEREAVKVGVAEAEEARRQAIRAARKAFRADGLYWGNYLDVEAAYNTARRMKGRQLKFRKTRPEGTVSVWFQQGLPVPSVWGDDSRLQIEPVMRPKRDRSGEEEWDGRTIRARLRVGSDGPRNPRYVEVQAVLHRPLPDDGVIRHASIVRERIASHVRHRLLVTVNVGAAPEPAEVPHGPVIGVDVGWRRMPDGALRVAYAAAPSGFREELRLPARLVGAFTKVDDLRSIRDKRFNDARAALVAWLKANAALLPDWLTERTATLAHWRSAARLAALALHWRERRFAGDAEGYEPLEAWRKRDKHLWEWEANQRDKALRRRRELYRVFAARLSAHAGKVVVEDFDLRGVTGAEEETDASARQRTIASVGQLRAIMEQTCAREGVAVERVEAAWTTQTCHGCANRVFFDARSEVRATCGHCGAEWDQDYNAAMNLARLGEARADAIAVA